MKTKPQKGTRVSCPQYGHGTVIGHGRKRIDTARVKFDRLKDVHSIHFHLLTDETK